MSGRYAKLKKDWVLRGWTDLPWAVVNWISGDIRVLQKRSFYVAEACDGNMDFDSLAFLPVHQVQLDTLIAEGIVEPCQMGEGIEMWQRYRRAENPRLAGLYWSVTGLCNLNCRHCYIEAPSGRYGEFAFEDMLRLIDQFEQANVMNISLTGGEPFLRKDLLAIMEALAQRKICVSQIYSNGLLISEEILEGIKKVGFTPSFQISYDGCGSHDYWRGTEGIESSVIDAIRKVRTAGFPVVVATSVDKTNISRLGETYILLKDLDIQYWRITPPRKMGNWREVTTAVSLDEEADAYVPLLDRWLADDKPFIIQLGGLFWGSRDGVTEGEEPKPRFTPESYDCFACREKPFLMPDGTLLPCPGYVGTVLQRRMPNILRENLSRVWYQSPLRKIADMKKRDLLAKNAECRQCDLFEKCGIGCRSSAMAETGDFLAKDPIHCEIWRKGYRDYFRSLASVGNR